MLLLASDEEDSHCHAKGKAVDRAKLKGHEQIDVFDLVSRSCRCDRKNCFNQFSGFEKQVIDKRSKLASLDPEDREHAVRELFNCSKLFSVAAPVDTDCSPSDSELLIATDSEEELLHTTSGESDEDSILLASDVEEPPKRKYQTRRSQITFLGKEVCVYALQSLIGVGSSTLQRIRAGEQAFTNRRRKPAPKHPIFGFTMNDSNVSKKWTGVVMFLWQTYHSCAEIMPTDFKMPRDREIQVPETKDPDLESRLVNHFLLSLETMSSDPDVHQIGPGTFSGPCRWLQASSRTELYWEYYASCLAKNMDPASYSTFLRVANSILRPGMKGGHLKFRGVNQHGKCNVCYELKLKIKKAPTNEQRKEAYRLYSSHLLSQWLDRQQYWSFRTMSHTWVKTMAELGHKMLISSVASNCLCVNIDGMDQSKFRIPRIHRGNNPKMLQALFRPTLHVTGSWLHGHRLGFWVSDEDLRKDSTTQQEVLSRTLSDVYQRFQSLPLGLALQQDNCYREGKDRHIISHMILLVALRCFKFCVCSYLRPGHSHEDLDQAFSQQASLICRHTFDTPEQVVEILDSCCRPSEPSEQARKRHKNHKVEAAAYKLDEVAEWKDWSAVSGVWVKGLRYVGSVRITRRCDIDPSSMGWCTPQELRGQHPKNPGDIVLIAKKRMADAEPYAVVVVMTQERARALELGFQQPVGVAERRPLSDKVRKNIKTVGSKCLQHGIINQDAFTYLSSWSQGDWHRQQRPAAYNHLLHRWQVSFHLEPATPSWEAPSRIKHVDLTYNVDRNECDDGPSDDDEALAPIDM